MSNLYPIFDTLVSKQQKETLLQQRGRVIWMVGLSGSGKSTLARAAEHTLHAQQKVTMLLDGDNLRTGVNNNLGFSQQDRVENIRRAAEVAKLFAGAGVITICSLITPTQALRELARSVIGSSYFEVYIDCPLEVCEQRDVKGLYAKARRGEISDFTGVSAPFEAPQTPDLRLPTHQQSLEESHRLVSEYYLSPHRPMISYNLTHLQQLESEAIFIMREVAAQFERPVLLFSGGKDSIVMVRLAQKAFWPAKVPFPLLHIDTGHNFPETIAFRDELVEKLGATLQVRYVQESIDQGRAVEEKGPNPSRNGLQTITLLEALEELKVDAAFGGARRDEEKARAKERFFSHRDEFGQWNPRQQRPELWNLFNGRKNMGEHFRVFPLSNWTEMDVWQYIAAEQLAIPPIYFSHPRTVVERDGALLAQSEFITLMKGETYQERQVRFRTVGDMTCTGAVESPASSLEAIIAEVAAATVTERGGRADDKRSEAAMEDRKKQGYF